MISNEKKAEVFEMLQVELDSIMDRQGFIYVGRTSEGLAFQDESFNSVVIKLIAKKDNFDIEEALTDYEIKQKATAERKAKADKNKAKAKAKKEKTQKVVEKIEEKKKELVEKVKDKKEPTLEEILNAVK